MRISKIGFLAVIFFIFLFQPIVAQTIIWSEDFSSYANGTNNINLTTQKWWTEAYDADDGGIKNNSENYWGVNNGEFVVNDIEGTWACGSGTSKGGNNDNFWYSESIDVSAYSQFVVSMKGRAVGDMECADDGEPCNSADLLIGSYQIDGGVWISFFSMCGAKSGDISSGCVKISNAHILKLRIQAGTQANGETYYFDDIVVTAQPVISGSNSVEKGSSISLSIDATGGTWSSNNANIATVNTSGKVTGVAVGTTTIKYTSIGGCETTVIITVTNPCTTPAILITTPASRCDVGTVTLTATASAGSINWYTEQTGGVAKATGNSFTTPTLPTTTSYYVEAVSGSCISPRTEVKATINETPVILSTTGDSRCGAGTLTLLANASDGTLSWYEESSGGSSKGSGNSFITPFLNVTKLYYVEAVNGTCVSVRSEVQATIVELPVLNTKTDNSCCQGASTELNAMYSIGTINWYEQAIGGTSLGSGSMFTTPPLSATAIYYVEAVNGTCVSSRSSVTATVKQIPIIGDFNLSSASCNGDVFSVIFPDNINMHGSTAIFQGWEIETSIASNSYLPLSIPYVFDCNDNGKRIRYKIETECDLTYSIAKFIQIQLPEPLLILPTIVTPYQIDGKNDVFGKTDLTGADLLTYFPNGYSFHIFNRIGQLVATTHNEGWDAKIKGQAADPGVYYYILRTQSADGEWQIIKKATVEVIKK